MSKLKSSFRHFRFRGLSKSALLLIVVATGCASYAGQMLQQRYGEPEPRDRIVEVVPEGQLDYWTDVKPVLEQNCVVCHACYDAPCQMKLGSIEGIERGASPIVVYKQSRVNRIDPTRLYEDAQTVAEWREKGFFAVLNEYENSPQAVRDASVMHRILKLKEANPLPGGDLLPDSFDLQLNRDQFCAEPETFDKYASKHPLWGMPYALPGLEPEKQAVLLQWLEEGAVYTERPPLPEAVQQEVARWEAFLNGDTPKEQLVNRYIYEHLFLAHLYFPDLDNRRFFKLIRSSTPPGEKPSVIATNRPYDDPGVERVYYRLVEEREAIVAKTHMPYVLDDARMERWTEFFVKTDFEVTELPSYSSQVASNPFKAFEALPVESRYRFMLDEARFTIMNFIKGPVCRGQVALNVIDDHFWVFFIDPDNSKINHMQDFTAGMQTQIELPAAKESRLALGRWRGYARQQKELIAQADAYLTERVTDPDGTQVSLDLIWDGNGENDNASLTIFRHNDSATVVKGLVGRSPKTAWVIDYGLLEKIHYLLVAGYDVFDNVDHQILSRLFMDFLRMEGELAFLYMLPPEVRDAERAYWYRGAEKEVTEFMTLPRFESHLVPMIEYKTDQQKLELYGMLKERLAQVLPQKYGLETMDDDYVRDELERLNDLKGAGLALLPQVSFLEVRDEDSSEFATILGNKARLSITTLFGEGNSLEPEEDTLTVVNGFLGAYPNAFLTVDQADLGDFVERVTDLSTEADYTELLNIYGVRRTNAGFWAQSERFHSAFREDEPVEHGLFDFNRLENR